MFNTRSGKNRIKERKITRAKINKIEKKAKWKDEQKLHNDSFNKDFRTILHGKNINNKCKKDKIITNRDFKVQKDIINDHTAVHMKTDQCSSAGYCWPSGQAD